VEDERRTAATLNPLLECRTPTFRQPSLPFLDVDHTAYDPRECVRVMQRHEGEEGSVGIPLKERSLMTSSVRIALRLTLQ